jgi:hypothetical protein
MNETTDIKMTKTFIVSELFDLLTGAGHEQYPWWAGSSCDEEKYTYTISGFKLELDEDMWAYDDPNTYITRTFTVGEMVQVFNNLPEDPSGDLIRTALNREDFDANDTDCFWQIAIYGEVVFG